MRQMVRRVALALALCCAGMGVWSAAGSGQQTVAPGPSAASASSSLLARGRSLFATGCTACHGEDLRGRAGQGPSLRGVGAAAADFYLSTGRMPLADPKAEPTRHKPAYAPADIAALDAYVGSFGGPGIPGADPSKGMLAKGSDAFTLHCAGCHQVAARGGIVTGAAVPSLQQATPQQIAEAVRVGPYLMPKFSEGEIDQRKLDDITRYVLATRSLDDRGGWGIGHIGPIPEGMIAWLLAGLVLVGVARIIGERAT